MSALPHWPIHSIPASAEVGIPLFLSTIPVLAALVVGALLGSRGATIRLACAFLSLHLLAMLARIALAIWWDSVGMAVDVYLLVLWIIELWPVAASIPLFVRATRGFEQSLAPLFSACFLLLVAPVTGDSNYFQEKQYPLWQAYNGAAAPDVEDTSFESKITSDELWEAQPALLEKSASSLAATRPGHSGFYLLAMAPHGHQELFPREAKAALKVLGRRYGADIRGEILLSNGKQDLLHVPMATRGNLQRVINDIAGRMDAARDTLVIYLTSHGGSDAALETGLYDYSELRGISANSLAKALESAGIKRRIVIVSACYSGTWIEPLKSDDTIVLTASAADRNSFGCSEERELTYFGEALLQGKLDKGASLAQAFAEAKRSVARMEQAQDYKPSNPQSYVGSHMTTLWQATALAGPASRD